MASTFTTAKGTGSGQVGNTDLGATLPLSTNGVEQYGAGSAGANDPQISMYSGYKTATLQSGINGTFSLAANALNDSLKLNVYDPWGASTRPEGGREYTGPWVNPKDYSSKGAQYYDSTNQLFKYNQFFMTMAQNFDPFMQKKEAAAPHWWLNRIPRGAYQLFNGTVQETRIYRGGLSHYAGLGAWEDLAPDPTTTDACAPMSYKTYQYAWETMAWSGKKTAWGSDPICIEVLKFTPKAAEQLGWILETGVKFGTAIQNVWNRDMFIYNTVQAKRSYVMTSEYRGAGSPRYVYQPFVKFGSTGSAGTANKNVVAKPFILIDASAGIEPLNFDVLDIVRNQLKRRCPESAVGRVGNDLMFALAVSEEDVEKYIRGNEEERRYWIEANPNALIQHYGFAPTTFRKWTITCDDEQLRFKLTKYLPAGSSLQDYGYVGQTEFTDGGSTDTTNVPLWVAEYVPPEIAGRPGINGSPIPVPNPAYDLAEIAIAPVFMNKVFTNLFVPDVTNLGSGTWFGPKKGLNGKWAWRNIQTPDNPDNKIGNFYGEFQIVPKPDTCVFDCISFVYRRCAEPLPALCPIENTKINAGMTKTGKVAKQFKVSDSSATDEIELKSGIIAMPGDKIYIKAKAVDDTSDSSAASTPDEIVGMVYASTSNTKKSVQIIGLKSGAVLTAGKKFIVPVDASVTVE